jgi:uncharacterized protein
VNRPGATRHLLENRGEECEMDDLIGVGWAFPVVLDGQGNFAMASGVTKVEQSIQIILGTRLGERVMRPTFGSRLHELLFAPLNAVTLGLAERYTAEALRFWEPRIDLLSIHARADDGSSDRKALRFWEPRIDLLSIHARADDGSSDRIWIEVAYRIKHTYDERSLVYPFYRIPGEPSRNA